jgi:hypothetical protein
MSQLSIFQRLFISSGVLSTSAYYFCIVCFCAFQNLCQSIPGGTTPPPPGNCVIDSNGGREFACHICGPGIVLVAETPGMWQMISLLRKLLLCHANLNTTIKVPYSPICACAQRSPLLWYKQFNYVLGSCKAWLLFLDHLLYSRSLKI